MSNKREENGALIGPLIFTLPAFSFVVRSFQSIVPLAAALVVIGVASRASADEVTRWNQVATDATAAAKTNPLKESRIFAILHVAIHDTVNAVESRYEPYQPRTSPALAGASVEAAIAGAAHATLVALLPDSKAIFDAALEETLRAITDHSRRTAGLEVGRPAAAAILTARQNDGEDRTVSTLRYEARRLPADAAGL